MINFSYRKMQEIRINFGYKFNSNRDFKMPNQQISKENDLMWLSSNRDEFIQNS